MQGFLQKVALDYLSNPGAGEAAFVFPNRRAPLFFQKYLLDAGVQESALPPLLSIHDLAFRLTGLSEADRPELLLSLLSPRNETRDYGWAETLLGDFDEVDKHLIDARMLFTNVTDLRQIESDYSYLSPSQIEAIRSFWRSFQLKVGGLEELYPLYTSLRQQLLGEGKGYEGMAFRQMAESAETLSLQSIPCDRLVFVGLYGHTPAERRLVDTLLRRGLAQEVIEPAADMASLSGQIEVVGVPSGIGQAKYVHGLLSEWAQAGKLEGEEGLRTAILLPDDSLLLPLLEGMPSAVPQLNVTMGFPLSQTPASSLLHSLLCLQNNVQLSPPSFYHKDVLSLLSHPYLRRAASSEVSSLRQSILETNQIRVPSTSLSVTPLLRAVFSPLPPSSDYSVYLAGLLQQLLLLFPAGEDAEALRLYHSTLVRLQALLSRSGLRLQPDSYRHLLRHLCQSLRIPFSGEALAGVQVMGILESRSLHFDRLVILSMNEGIFPPRHHGSTFIPYALRRAFKLPLPVEQDKLRGQHFFRLLPYAGQVTLIYDSRSGESHTGEPSPFIHQLRYRHHIPLRELRPLYALAPGSSSRTLCIEKDESALPPSLSASAINTYLDCPLRFYFQYVEGTKEDKEVRESIESNIFGELLHDSLRRLYQPYLDRELSPSTLRKLSGDKALLRRCTEEAFAAIFFHSPEVRPLTGQYYLTGGMIEKYASRVLQEDAHLAPFRYLGSELRLEALLPLSRVEVRLKGFIDRLDTAGGGLRIVDYKSGGSGDLVIPTFGSLFDSSLPKRPKEAMQTLLYAWMYLHQSPAPPSLSEPLYTSVYFMRKLFTAPFSSGLRLRSGRQTTEPLGAFQPWQASFEEGLRGCLEEIFDPGLPFQATSDGSRCRYCPFCSVCG
ncbi:MAG: PD-(D/E)XK nuclease family protein [Tannerellaceae bacterium]|jgi:hypothetical protein|nr:PD-(D/E)XK nuclease family protein [Tannerellaceae bacterium]